MKTNLTLAAVVATCKELGFSVKTNAEYNVLLVKNQHALCEFDLGHTSESKQDAYNQIIRYCELESEALKMICHSD